MNIKVRVKCGMRKESIKAISKSTFEVSVREKPRDNQANERVVTLIAKHFILPTNRVRIVRGHHNTSKMLLIAD